MPKPGYAGLTINFLGIEYAAMIALAGLALLDLLTEEQRHWLAALGTRRSYQDGELIHRRGDRDLSMCVVISGRVRLTRLHADGTQTFVSSIHPGQHFGDVLLHGGRQRRTHDAVAVGAVRLDHYDADAFARVLENPVVVLALYRITALRLSGAMAMSDDLRALPREVHLAKILLALRTGDNPPGTIECVQDDLAALIGTSVMTLSKALGVLNRAGLIETGYRSLRIIDRKALSSWLAARSPE